MTTTTVAPITLPRPAVIAAFAAGAAILAVMAPLVAYAGSLALFGAPHVLAELRYVDGRFSRRIGLARGATIVSILGVAVALRALGLAQAIDARDAYVAELGLVAVLAFVVLPDLAATPFRAAFAVAVGAAVATGSALAPWTTIVVLSLLHNATPVGFLAERLSGTSRRRAALVACAVLFVGVPLLVAGAASLRDAASIASGREETSFASVGPLADHLRVFVPTEWVATQIALPLFSVAAYMQLLHYGAVLGVLPRLLGARGSEADVPMLPWPKARGLTLAIAVIGAVSAVAFFHDFAGTRAQYGLLASVHAWVEIPVLLFALAPATAAHRRIAGPREAWTEGESEGDARASVSR